jgi:hypothetical protein
MRRSTWLAMMGAAALATAALTQPALADNTQQQKMTSCNAEAKTKSLSGDDRKAFMKTCLSNSGSAAKPLNSQQEKMKTCSADAKTKALKGDERKKFMSDCLKGS